PERLQVRHEARHFAEVGVAHEVLPHPAGGGIHADPLERRAREEQIGAPADRVLEQAMDEDDVRSGDARPPPDGLPGEAPGEDAGDLRAVLQLGPNDERGEPGDVSQDEKARLGPDVVAHTPASLSATLETPDMRSREKPSEQTLTAGAEMARRPSGYPEVHEIIGAA